MTSVVVKQNFVRPPEKHLCSVISHAAQVLFDNKAFGLTSFSSLC